MANRSEELYEEREKRVTEAILLKVPDRVPVVLRRDGVEYHARPHIMIMIGGLRHLKKLVWISLRM